MEEVHEVSGGGGGVVHLLSVIVVAETHTDGLVDAQQVTKGVPGPAVFDGVKIGLVALDEEGS